MPQQVETLLAVESSTSSIHSFIHLSRLARFTDKFQWFFRAFSIGEILAPSKSARMSTARFCYWVPYLCEAMLASVMGNEDQDHVNTTRVPVYFGHSPSGTSAKNLVHFLQMAKANRFQKFDYGHRGNMLMYNSSTPPEYNLKNIHTPIVLMSGKICS